MFTPTFFRKTAQCHPFDDIVYLPTIGNPADYPPLRGNLIRKIIPGFPYRSGIPPYRIAYALAKEFERQCLMSRGKEPGWVHWLPRQYRAYVRENYATMEQYDHLFIIPGIPYTGTGYLVTEDGFSRHAMNAFGLWRLMGIAQLGKLHDPVVTDTDSLSYGRTFEHTRLVHSFDVRAIALLMAINNRLNPRDTRVLELAGLTHDARTPAYGDGTKNLDPAFFDEDAHYPDLLKGSGWDAFREAYGIDRRQLIDAVQGRGVLGTLLDVADKISYLSRDVAAYLRRYAPEGPVTYPQGYETVRRLVSGRPAFLGIWSTVEVKKDKVFFRDGRWLHDLLALRALMFKQLYFHHGSRYLERMTSMILVRHLLESGTLRKEALLRMSDFELDKALMEAFETVLDPYAVSSEKEFAPRVETFNTVREADERERELLRTGAASLTFIDVRPPVKAGTHFLVLKKGKLRPFAEAYPRETEEISAIIRGIPPVSLYRASVRRDELPPRVREVADARKAKVLGEHHRG